MKHTKKVTEAVRAANLENAQFSPGPQTEKGKAATSHNALRHGILARRMVLSEEEEKEYQEIWQYWNEHFDPIGNEEQFFVEEIADTFWKLGITEGLEPRELLRRLRAPDAIDRVFHGELELPVSDRDLPLNRGWDCEKIVVRAVAANDKGNSNTSRGPGVWQNQVLNAIKITNNSHKQEGGHLEVHAVLGSALETMTRYRSSLKRDFYRAIEKLHEIQAERKEREMKHSTKKPPASERGHIA